MNELSNPTFWAQRLKEAPENQLHWSVYKCRPYEWMAIGESHRKILESTIGPNDYILDVGCGYGHLLNLMPARWTGDYLGIDISPDLLEVARRHWPTRTFKQGDFYRLIPEPRRFDWAILIGIQGMFTRDAGEADWEDFKDSLRKVANRLLILNYNKEGPIIE